MVVVIRNLYYIIDKKKQNDRHKIDIQQRINKVHNSWYERKVNTCTHKHFSMSLNRWKIHINLLQERTTHVLNLKWQSNINGLVQIFERVTAGPRHWGLLLARSHCWCAPRWTSSCSCEDTSRLLVRGWMIVWFVANRGLDCSWPLSAHSFY